MSMSCQDLCDLLDELRIPTNVAADEMGIARVTLSQYLDGKRYPSHGGGTIEVVPKRIELAALHLASRLRG